VTTATSINDDNHVDIGVKDDDNNDDTDNDNKDNYNDNGDNYDGNNGDSNTTKMATMMTNEQGRQ
jgi:hypothetical protein